jgi:hypothetical protein
MKLSISNCLVFSTSSIDAIAFMSKRNGHGRGEVETKRMSAGRRQVQGNDLLTSGAHHK